MLDINITFVLSMVFFCVLGAFITSLALVVIAIIHAIRDNN
jgi:hypothetical protein